MLSFLTKSRFTRARKLKLFVCLGLLFILSRAMVFAQAIDWPTLGFTQVVTNIFTEPTCITHADDGSQRLFILSQPGQIWIIQNSNVLAQPFLDISSRVISYGAEQGLLGLAFPTSFSKNRHFYVDYTRQSDGAIVVSRFFLTATNSNMADPYSEQKIMVILKPEPFNNHNAGQIAFGPDGYLYVGVGDGGSENDPFNNGQKTTNALGKILRIDVESGVSPYAIPPSNPYATNSAYDPRIWAYGLRNPWRFSFDDQTGDLYIGDVGQYKYEEIDFQPAGSAGGQNYGWRIMEGDSNFNVPRGFTNFAALTLPVTTYSHASLPANGEAAVIGGYVYHGPSQPRMNGVYFYGDFITGWIWGLMRSGTNWQSQILFSPNYSGLPNPYNISTFGEDDEGNLYVSSYYNGTINEVQDTLQTWTPAFSPTNGVINSNTVVITCLTTNAQIHYTTNGAVPTLSDLMVPSGGSITVNPGITYMADAFRPDLSPSGVASASFTLQVGTPVFNPPSGSIVSNTTASISTVTPGAAIYYTTDGTTPTTNSPLYISPLTVSGGMTVKALGVATGYNNSAVASVSYSASQAATPVFSPSSGPVTNGTSISMSCNTPGAVIYYTLDGSTPTTSSAIYTSPITINGGTTVSAFAVATNYVNSSVRSTGFQLVQVATPVFVPSSGPITNNTPINITCATPGSTIYYTLDGTTPTTNSAVYTEPLLIQGGTTVSAFATANQYLNSGIQSTLYQQVQTATPTFIPGSGPITNGTPITITCATPGSTIYYTLDGTTPTTNSAVYTGPLIIQAGTTVSALATANQYLDSSLRSVLYSLLQTATPVFNPSQGPLTNNAVISISCASSNTIIYYTVNGSTPSTTNGFIYSSPLMFTNPMTLTALAYGSGLAPSSLQSTYYALYDFENTVVTTLAGSTVVGFTNGIGASASFSNPQGICIDNSGNLYVADTGNNVVREVSPSGQVTTFAGTGVAGSQLGTTTNSQFYRPTSVTFDNSGNLCVADSRNYRICKILPNGTVSQFYAPSGNPAFWQLEVDPFGNLDLGLGSAVEQISSSGSGIKLAGNDPTEPSYDACTPGWCPQVGIGVDSSGNVYAATYAMIYQITRNGTTTLYAGQPPGAFGNSSPGYSDGSRLLSWFENPLDATVDQYTNVFVGDSTRVRKIRFDGWVSTMAGAGNNGYQDGRCFVAQFNGAAGLCMDTNGNIYVADSGNNCIREISPDTAGIGIPDWWQLRYFNHVGIDPNSDPDNNGMTAYEDFWAGLNPTNPASVFKVVNASVTNGFFRISWTSVLGKNYTVQGSSDLKSWNTLDSPISGTGSVLSYTDSIPTSQSTQRYYRIVVSF